MTQINEGRLIFSFPMEMSATKYDEWSFYRNQFSMIQGTKAVDILVIENDTGWLVEVKDYRQHPRSKTADISDEISFKVRDTLAGLAAARFNANDVVEKTFSKNFLRLKKLKVVLHLEQSPGTSALFPQAINPANVKLKLKQSLKSIDAHPLVVNQYEALRLVNWTVAG